MPAYRWNNGSRQKGNAQDVGDRLNELQRDNEGRLTPRMVVDDARPKESPLHPCFEWSDLRAAELYREDQARKVIAAIRVVVKEGELQEPVRAFAHVIETVGDEQQSVYVPIARLRTEPELRKQVIEQARRDLISVQQRYREFKAIESIVDSAVTQLDDLLSQSA